MKNNVKNFLVAVFLLILVSGAYYANFKGGEFASRFAFLGILILLASYFVGLIALALTLLFSVFSFLTGLPLLSFVYGLLAYSLSRIHYTLFKKILEGALDRMRWYRNVKLRVKNSSAYKKLMKAANSLSKRLGLSEPHLIKFFEVKGCVKCGKEIPASGLFCPYCGVKQQIKPVA